MKRKSIKTVFAANILLIFLIVTVLSIIFTYVIVTNIRETTAKKYTEMYVSTIRKRLATRMKRDINACMQLSRNIVVRDWLKNERNPKLKKYAFQIFSNFSKHMENKPGVYAVVHKSKRYYLRNKFESVISPKNKIDNWYFATIHGGQKFYLDIDYDPKLDKTRFWINIPVKQNGKTLGVVGTGIDISVFLKTMLEIEQKGAFIVLFDKNGKIMAFKDRKYVNKKQVYSLFDTKEKSQELKTKMAKIYMPENRMQSQDLNIKRQGKQYLVSLAFIPQIDWFVLVFIDTSKIVKFSQFYPILTITMLSFVALLISIIFISNKMIIKRVLSLSLIMSKMKQGDLTVRARVLKKDEIGELEDTYNVMVSEIKNYTENLENIVKKRTNELEKKNKQILASIEYAKLIQHSILPASETLNEFSQDSFVIWKPKDIVGGDFYWFNSFQQNYLIGVIDCTGHGVPGALMTMTANSILNHIVDYEFYDPAKILRELNLMLRLTLHRQDTGTLSDDGLDISLMLIQPDKNKIVYSAARNYMFYKTKGEIKYIKGDKQSIGYESSRVEYRYTNHEIKIKKGDCFYLTTDGIIDQNGGNKNFALGKKRFKKLLENINEHPFTEQKAKIEKYLEEYKKDYPQRDDITVLGFRF